MYELRTHRIGAYLVLLVHFLFMAAQVVCVRKTGGAKATHLWLLVLSVDRSLIPLGE